MATTPTEQTQITSNIPNWMIPYAQQLLGTVFGGAGSPGLLGLGYQPYMVPQRDDQGNIVKDDSGNPVMVPGQRTAEFSPMQQQAFENLAGMRISPQLAQASELAGLAGIRAGELGRYAAAQPQNFYQNLDTSYQTTTAPQLQQYQMGPYEKVSSSYNYTPERVSGYQYGQLTMDPAERVRAQRLQQYRMGPAALVESQQFNPYAAEMYMSPYMQNVVERQKQAAVQDYARQIPGMQAAAARSGARGGTREALLQAEARRNLGTQLGDIQAQGSQSAYQQGMQQYNVDQAQRMQAQLANQAAIQDVARQNLQAAMGIQSLGSGQNLQAQLANQQAGLTVGQQNLAAEQARQQFMGNQSLQAQQLNQAAMQRSAEFAAQQQMQAALANQQAGLTTGQQNLAAQLGVQQLGAQNTMQSQLANQQAQLQAQQQALAQRATQAQYGLAGAQLGESSRQFGANLGLQGLQQQLAAAGALGGLGMQQYQQNMGINQALIGAGGQQQALNQQMLDQAYQDFINQQQFPYKQAEFAMGILRGLPASGQTSTFYQQPGSLFGQIAGVGLGLGSLFGGIGGGSGGSLFGGSKP